MVDTPDNNALSIPDISTVSDTLAKLDHGTYVNTKTIVFGGVPYSARDVLLKAPLIAGINAYLVGGTGEGKTQLAHDLTGYFGTSACYSMGRPDFEPAELLKQVRLDKLKDASSDRELVELTENVLKHLYYVDELNRCPPIVQNYFFDFFDGKLVHQGKIMRLGREGYSLGYATGNLGDGEYVGISDSDRALLDRMHMIVKLDHPDYATREVDDFNIFSGKKDPRASMPGGEDISSEIVALHRTFGERKVAPLLPLIGVYLHKGLDYLEATPSHSKRALEKGWPSAEGIRTDNHENKVFPLSKRAIFGAISLTCALEMLAEQKGFNEANGNAPHPLGLFLDSLRLIVPYSGVISPAYVDMTHSGDVYTAYDALFAKIKSDIMVRAEDLETAVMLAEGGIIEPKLLRNIAPEEGNWTAVRNALVDYAALRAENPTPVGMEVKRFVEEAHKV